MYDNYKLQLKNRINLDKAKIIIVIKSVKIDKSIRNQIFLFFFSKEAISTT